MERTILITGSAKGLGAALTRGLAKDGHQIAIHYRTSRQEAEETLAAIAKAGGKAAIFGNPLASLADGEKLVGEIIARFGKLDTLINNAGVFNRSRFGELTQAEWDEGWASTASAAFYATRAALPHLRGSGRGRIINIGDAKSDQPGLAEPAMSYYIGKVGLWMMTQTLAATEAPHRVTVNMISPGVLEESICSTPLAEMPMGRFSTPEDVLGPVRLLLKDSSGALTGSNLHVSGGWHLASLHANAINQAGSTKSLPDGTG
ncbi:MAG TPA: SDR family NAD(P)-dependent oxidoreductase [Candidatus Methylacidiphilales bacterium]|nr:SDR family NAD(P)-dependent oxidoreductase [Candidatus Methylacidiphilales bacterium]